jgi:2-polyprenyl-3-methyl-5-hydroxy-6-metoxy-1,4-benzoquinol methylase
MKCPACGYNVNNLYLESEDYFLTGEKFDIHKCDGCGLLLTIPCPEPSELGRYYESTEYLSHNTQKQNLKTILYGAIRKRNLSHKYTIINKYKQGGHILDYGCGTADFLAWCKIHNWKITGIEPNENARKVAREKNQIEPLQESEIKNLPPKSFDLITLWHVLEHVPNLHERIEDFKTLLKDDGIILIAVPNASAWDASHYKKFWAAWDLPRHLYHFTPDSLLKLFASHQLTRKDTLPMKFDAFYICLLSEQYKKNLLAFPFAFVNGLRSNFMAKNKPERFSSFISIFKKG